MNDDSYKAYFLGPKSENESWVRSELQSILDYWFQARKSRFETDPPAISSSERLSAPYLQRREALAQQLAALNELLRDEVPKYTPRYIGHMVSETSLPAIFGHFATLLHNPNNTSREVSKVGSVIEAEAIAMLADMLGFDPARARGHFTSGGTVANFEAFWRARHRMESWLRLAFLVSRKSGQRLDIFRAAHMGWDAYAQIRAAHGIGDEELALVARETANPVDFAQKLSEASGAAYRGPVVLAPGSKHFSWQKGADLFGLGEEAFWSVALGADGKMDVEDLRAKIDRAREATRPVLLVVAVAGTTEAGEIDPVDAVTEALAEQKAKDGVDIWLHIDAAYGGFFCALLGSEFESSLSPANVAALRHLCAAQSITIDPHKLGYVPYSCGAFIACDADAYATTPMKAAYLDRPDLGAPIWASTIEGSRSGAGAAAAWLTGRTIGYGREFGELLAATIAARRDYAEAIDGLAFTRLLTPADTNILCFSIARTGDRLSEANRLTELVFDQFVRCQEFSVSRTVFRLSDYRQQIVAHVDAYDGIIDADGMTLIRCVFMNPFLGDRRVMERLRGEFCATLEKFIDLACFARPGAVAPLREAAAAASVVSIPAKTTAGA